MLSILSNPSSLAANRVLAQSGQAITRAVARLALQREAATLVQASRQRRARTTFNGQALLDGSLNIQGFVGQSDAAVALHLAPLFLSRTTDVLFRFAQFAQATTSATPTGALSAGNLTINGQSVGATVAGSGDPVPMPLDEAAGYDQNANLTSVDNASATIGIMDRKLEKLLALRTQLGAALNALEVRNSALSITQETALAAVSRVLDADYATEITEFTRAGITRSAGLAMLAQANLLPQQTLLLLLPTGLAESSTGPALAGTP